MKKIIIFLSVVFLITTIFTVTTFASSDESAFLSAGEYAIREVLPFDTSVSKMEQYAISFTSGGKFFNRIMIYGKRTEYQYILYQLYDGDTKITEEFAYHSDSSKVTDSNLSVIQVTENTLLNVDHRAYFLTFFKSNIPEPTECDGTVCPLTDENYDNVCDDCGLPVTYSLRSTMLDYARSEIDRALSGAVSSGQYWLIFDRTSDTNTGQKVYYSYISAEPFYEEDGKLYAGSDGKALVHRQMITENADGTFSSSGWSSSQTGNIPVNLTLIVDSSHEKSFFFQMPLWEIVQEAGQMEMKTKTLKSVGEVMLVLTIAGASLIALLVGLVLLSRKLRTYLPR